MQDNVTQAVVKQVDREAFADFKEYGFNGDGVEWMDFIWPFRNGRRDGDRLVQAFAAHRIASTTAQTEAVQTLVDALEEISDLHGEINPSNYDHDDACELNRQFCYAITTAAAALAAHRESQP